MRLLELSKHEINVFDATNSPPTADESQNITGYWCNLFATEKEAFCKNARKIGKNHTTIIINWKLTMSHIF